MNIVVKNSFLDKENKNKKVEAGTPLTVSKERGERLVSLGFAVAASEPEAKVLKASTEKS